MGQIVFAAVARAETFRLRLRANSSGKTEAQESATKRKIKERPGMKAIEVLLLLYCGP